jgi:hypothetical protein
MPRDEQQVPGRKIEFQNPSSKNPTAKTKNIFVAELPHKKIQVKRSCQQKLIVASLRSLECPPLTPALA